MIFPEKGKDWKKRSKAYEEVLLKQVKKTCRHTENHGRAMEIATMIRSAAVFRNSNAALSTESNVFVFITPERDYILENCRCTNLNKVFEKF